MFVASNGSFAGNIPPLCLINTLYITSINHIPPALRANIFKKTIPNTIPNTIPKCQKQAKNRKNDTFIR